MKSKPVRFKFALEQKVQTPFDNMGIVAMQAVDAGGVHYFIQMEKSLCWYRESQLRAWESN